VDEKKLSTADSATDIKKTFSGQWLFFFLLFSLSLKQNHSFIKIVTEQGSSGS
jgi:hypothetical protein